MTQTVPLSQFGLYLILAASIALSAISYSVGVSFDRREVYTMKWINNLFLLGGASYTAVEWWKLPHFSQLMAYVKADKLLPSSVDPYYSDALIVIAMILVALLPHVFMYRGNTRVLKQMGAC